MNICNLSEHETKHKSTAFDIIGLLNYCILL